MRLFIAVNCNGETKSRLLDIRDRIKVQAEKGNFSRPENLHLTLAFLGETPEVQVPAIRSTLSGLGDISPFTVQLSRTGCFKHGNKELWWIGADRGDAGFDILTELRQRIAGGLISAGIVFDKRPFNAHITLGREIKHAAPITVPGETITLPVRRISLMKSEHSGGMLVYTEIFGQDLSAAPVDATTGMQV
jgi:2'-5' RNA ligase